MSSADLRNSTVICWRGSRRGRDLSATGGSPRGSFWNARPTAGPTCGRRLCRLGACGAPAEPQPVRQAEPAGPTKAPLETPALGARAEGRCSGDVPAEPPGESLRSEPCGQTRPGPGRLASRVAGSPEPGDRCWDAARRGEAERRCWRSRRARDAGEARGPLRASGAAPGTGARGAGLSWAHCPGGRLAGRSPAGRAGGRAG